MAVQVSAETVATFQRYGSALRVSATGQRDGSARRVSATGQRDGAVLIKGLWADRVGTLRAGVARNMAHPGPCASENLKPGETGRFFDDCCNCTRIPGFAQVIRGSSLVQVAAALMQSQTVPLFHEHVLVKEPGTAKPTPWHQDGPYDFVGGQQNVSFWSQEICETGLRDPLAAGAAARRRFALAIVCLW